MQSQFVGGASVPANYAYVGVPDPNFGDVNFRGASAITSGITLIPHTGDAFGTGTIALQVRKKSAYLFGYAIRGSNDVALRGLVFEIRVNGLSVPGPQARYKSEVPSAFGSSGQLVILNGKGILNLNAGDVVTLRNITNVVGSAGFGDPVSLGLGDIDASDNASVYLLQIPPTLP